MFSGGLDSTVLLAHLIERMERPIAALHFSGLSCASETLAARSVAQRMAVETWIIDLSSLWSACRKAPERTPRSGERALFGATTISYAALAIANARGVDSLAMGWHR